jgi:hypothetical protein
LIRASLPRQQDVEKGYLAARPDAGAAHPALNGCFR